MFVPLLFEYLHKQGVEDPQLTQLVIANSISLTFFSTLTSFLHRRKELKNQWRQPVIIGLTASLFSILSFQFIVLQGYVNKQLMALLLLFTIVFTMVRNLIKSQGKQTGKADLSSISRWATVSVGAISGLFASVSGLGGGVIVVPVLSEMFKINLRLSQTVSVLVVSISAFLLSLSNFISFKDGFEWQTALIKTQMIVPTIMGIIIGIPIGNWLYPKISPAINKLIFVGVLTYIAYVNLRILFV